MDDNDIIQYLNKNRSPDTELTSQDVIIFNKILEEVEKEENKSTKNVHKLLHRFLMTFG